MPRSICACAILDTFRLYGTEPKYSDSLTLNAQRKFVADVILKLILLFSEKLRFFFFFFFFRERKI